ncbi:hypothetical protein NMG60_11018301 [Bertholletia excelsa]
MVGGKRGSTELGEKSELGRKRAKMRDLEPLLHPQEKVEGKHQFSVSEESQVSNHSSTTNSYLKTLDINTQERDNRVYSSGNQEKEQGANFLAPRPFNWDLNAENTSLSPQKDAFYPYKTHEIPKSGDASECGSTTGPLQEKDPIKVWREMKRNGFLSSSSHGGIPMPKPRGRRGKGVLIEKKLEMAKREHIDRFARVAAPSGLLNELNPGIINHVRNSKQVYSIIEALVRSEKVENRRDGSKKSMQPNAGANEIIDKKRTSDNSVHSGGVGGASKLKKRTFDKATCLSHPKQDAEEDMVTLKLLSAMGSENISCLSNEESSNPVTVSSLSLKAAAVASQWLELLYQDIKGRLAVLRRSKKRVRSVIHTELPLLLSQEFSSNQENDPCVVKNSCSLANAHQAKWNALFDQMNKALSEEEEKLESWLHQVKEMQLHCERGLQHFQCNSLHGSECQGTAENDRRLEVKRSENELAVRASAASIYSTCNFLLTEN